MYVFLYFKLYDCLLVDLIKALKLDADKYSLKDLVNRPSLLEDKRSGDDYDEEYGEDDEDEEDEENDKDHKDHNNRVTLKKYFFSKRYINLIIFLIFISIIIYIFIFKYSNINFLNILEFL